METSNRWRGAIKALIAIAIIGGIAWTALDRRTERNGNNGSGTCWSLKDRASRKGAKSQDTPKSPKGSSEWSAPIGVFDSGTGGFTVLERILALDSFDNASGELGADGQPDFAAEDFQYLADQANMPYGRYDAEGKAYYLRDLAVKDAFFLTGTEYSSAASCLAADCIKKDVKIIVIGCNTATAYGLDAIRDTLARIGSHIKVVGVVEAGAKAAIEQLREFREKDGTSSDSIFCAGIGVLATPGTISSGVYPRMISEAMETGMSVDVVCQSGYGFAEAVDEEKEFVDRTLGTFSGSYRGPQLGTEDADIDASIFEAYNFNFSDSKGFVELTPAKTPSRVQLNASENYARYNLTSLLEKARKRAAEAKASGTTFAPLRCIILGCTHYPFLLGTMEEHLAYLKEYSNADGSKPYADLIADDCVFIDPAENTAIECYKSLKNSKLLTKDKDRAGHLDAFISVPSSHLPDSCLTPDGGLTYAFKYGREVNDGTLSTVVVPMTPEVVNADNLERIKRLLPLCWKKLSE